MTNRELERRYIEMKLTYKNLVNANVELVDENKMLKEEIERLYFIIKEAKEFIYENAYDTERENCIDDLWGEIPKLLEILDSDDTKM